MLLAVPHPGLRSEPIPCCPLATPVPQVRASSGPTRSLARTGSSRSCLQHFLHLLSCVMQLSKPPCNHMLGTTGVGLGLCSIPSSSGLPGSL